MTKSVTNIAIELADRESIRDCLHRYCRGIDRLDEELLRSSYWPDAIDEHAGFIGSGEEFIAHAIAALTPLDQTMHSLSNVTIDIDGDLARTESYFSAFHRIPEAGSVTRDLMVGGRYVDRMEKRNDEWRIAHRVVIIDWFRHYPDSADWNHLPLGMQVTPGIRYPHDRSYALLARTSVR